MNALLTLILITTAWTYPRVDADMPLFPQSAATVDNIVAGLINPAGLAPGSIIGMRYMHAFTDSSFKGDDGFIISTRGTVFSLQWLNHTNDIFRRKFLIANGKRLYKGLYWGLSYAWFTGSSNVYKKKKVWKAGFLYRPRPSLSFGLVIDDINRPKYGDTQTERFYTLAAAYVAFQRKLVFSVDSYYQEKDKFDEIEALFRVEYKTSKKLRIVSAYQTDGFIQIGIAYLFEYVDIGLSSRFIENDYLGGTFYYNQGPMPGR